MWILLQQVGAVAGRRCIVLHGDDLPVTDRQTDKLLLPVKPFERAELHHHPVALCLKGTHTHCVSTQGLHP